MTNIQRQPVCHIIELNLAKEISHGMHVSNLAYYVSRELGLSPERCRDMAVAGLLHDIGKVEIAKRLYGMEEETLTVEELKYVRTHSTLGYTILKNYDYCDFILESILYHHENYDGTGYPSNLAEAEIPLGARILRVCDVFAALTSERPYRKSFDVDTGVELMIEEVKNFDMKVFLAFMRVIHEDGLKEKLKAENIEFKVEEDLT